MFFLYEKYKNKNLCDITVNSLKCLGYFPLTSLLSNQRVVHHVDFSEVTQDELLSFTIQIAFKIDKTGISSFCVLREITQTYFPYFVFCILNYMVTLFIRHILVISVLHLFEVPSLPYYCSQNWRERRSICLSVHLFIYIYRFYFAVI